MRPSFFLQAEDGIRDYKVTGVQTCALPISNVYVSLAALTVERLRRKTTDAIHMARESILQLREKQKQLEEAREIGRASCRESEEIEAEEGRVEDREGQRAELREAKPKRVPR